MLASTQILNVAEAENHMHHKKMQELLSNIELLKKEIEIENLRHEQNIEKLYNDYKAAKANEQLEIYAAISAFEYAFEKSFLDFYGELEIREALGDDIFELLLETNQLECCGKGTDGCLYFTPLWR